MITYPIAIPSSPYFRSCRFSLAEAVAFTESPWTFSRQYQRHLGSLCTVSAELPPMNRAEGQRWIAFLLALRGGTGTFLLPYPELQPLGPATGSDPRLLGAHSVSAEELDTTGWIPNTAGILRAGDVIQIGTGLSASLYQVLQDANSDTTGLAVLDIAPRLRRGWSSGTPLVTSGVQAPFRLARPVASYDLDDLRFYGLSLDAVEALP